MNSSALNVNTVDEVWKDVLYLALRWEESWVKNYIYFSFVLSCNHSL